MLVCFFILFLPGNMIGSFAHLKGKPVVANCLDAYQQNPRSLRYRMRSRRLALRFSGLRAFCVCPPAGALAVIPVGHLAFQAVVASLSMISRWV